jgi:hypothetical protein
MSTRKLAGPDVVAAPALRLTEELISNGGTGIREDAELGNVLLEMFHDNYSDAGRETFTQAAARCAIDELAIIALAVHAEDGGGLEEVPRLLEHMRHRLLVAQWLDRRVEDALNCILEPEPVATTEGAGDAS